MIAELSENSVQHVPEILDHEDMELSDFDSLGDALGWILRQHPKASDE